MGVPLHRPDVPLALPGDLAVTLVRGIQVDYVEEAAAARQRYNKAASHAPYLQSTSSQGTYSLVTRTLREAFNELCEKTSLRTLRLTT